MSLAKHSNHGASIKWSYNTEGFNYVKPAELEEGKAYTIHGLFVTKDNGYGNGSVAILDDCFLNLPAGELETVKAILADPDSVASIDAGNEKISIYSFTSERFKKTGYAVNWL